jgi:2-C-methyl-D-erythritol 4-phosphate cytidylyltransferase
MKEIVVVAEKEWHSFFPKETHFALPGKERQDSVYSGLMALQSDAEFIIIHDSARPFLEEKDLYAVMSEGEKIGAAALAVPVTSTIKQVDRALFITSTLPRETLYEVQTPQVVRRDWLYDAFEKVHQEHLTVTDDLSLIEHLGHPAKLVLGSPKNIKITSPLDLRLADA